MQLHRLEGFYWVAVCGGYTRAAREFPYPITQPAVHQQVKKLEDELGTRLFERVAKDQVRLTSAGRSLFDFCEPFFRDLPGVCRGISARQFGGTLRIDAAALEIRYILPSWIKQLRRARPDIRVMLREVDLVDPKRLLSSDVDLVVDFATSVPRGLVGRRVGTHHAFVVFPASYRKRNARDLVKLLTGRPFVSYSAELPHFALQMQALESRGLAPESTLSASSTEAILGFVQAELGYSIVPWPAASGPRLGGVVAARQRGPGTEFPILALHKQRAEPDPLVEAALSLLDPLGH